LVTSKRWAPEGCPMCLDFYGQNYTAPIAGEVCGYPDLVMVKSISDLIEHARGSSRVFDGFG